MRLHSSLFERTRKLETTESCVAVVRPDPPGGRLHSSSNRSRSLGFPANICHFSPHARVSHRSAFCSIPLQDEVQSPKSSLLKFHAPDASNLASSATREDVFFFPTDRLAPWLEVHYLTYSHIPVRVPLTSIARKDFVVPKNEVCFGPSTASAVRNQSALAPNVYYTPAFDWCIKHVFAPKFHSPSTNSLIRPPSSRLATNVWKKPLGLVNICVPASSDGTHRWRSANSIVSLFCSA